MEAEENEDNVSEEDSEDLETRRHLEKLKEYIDQMAYKPVKPPKASEHTENLAKVPKRTLIDTYSLHKDNLKPKERSERYERIVQEHTPMTIEYLEDFVKNFRKKRSQSEKLKKQQQIKFEETLAKLQAQCERQLMNAIVHKFAKVVTKRACNLPAVNTKVETESYKRLENALICNMILNLNVSCHEQTRNLTLYKKLAAVFADMMLQALFMANTTEDELMADDELKPEVLNEKDLIIQERALRAAKKKVKNRRMRLFRECGPMCHMFK